MNNTERLRQIAEIDQEIEACYARIAVIDEEMSRLRAAMNKSDKK